MNLKRENPWIFPFCFAVIVFHSSRIHRQLFNFNKNKKLLMTYEELLKNHAGEMTEKLVTDVVTKDAVEVRFDFADNEQWSVISMHNYEEDKEISLRLQSGERYELYFGYYDDDDEFFEISHVLSPEEIKIIPKGLQKVMQKVLSDERGMRLPGNFLSK
jgi:hypothetical protein